MNKSFVVQFKQTFHYIWRVNSWCKYPNMCQICNLLHWYELSEFDKNKIWTTLSI